MHEDFFPLKTHSRDLCTSRFIRGRSHTPSRAITALPTRVSGGEALAAPAPCRAPAEPRRDRSPSPRAELPPGGISQRRGRPLLPALVNGAEAERGAGGRGRDAAAPRPAAWAGSGAGGENGWEPRHRHQHQHRHQHHRPGAPPPPSPSAGMPPGPAEPGGASGSGPGATPELLCASASEARAFRAPTAVTLFALAVNSLRLPPPPTPPHNPPCHRVKSRLTIPS